ncbi:GNAT family N-acetyltransferase [Roseibium sp. RKSG952]|uniref:GNAT family N-acetyltransferase n=1 Tax=Roseibium sp. RKSG952 TaxID=2529384 RepID=UPI0012BD0826|nr:GNAT family N-acetyltransferase [Roseibium sp. RKSG952]MTH97381.1 GNAT family N-acetyltransferase [Roseibium sp. RKSG952]
MQFDYRPLGPDDWRAWHALFLEGVRDFPMGFLVTPAETEARSEEHCRKILANNTSRGVFTNGRLAGCCSYRPQSLERTRHRAEIGPFFVSRAFHGTGAADVLMTGVIQEARDAGIIEQLELFVDTENHRAIGLYQRHGFKRVAIFPNGVRIDGCSRDAHFCILRLNKPEQA